MMQLFVAVGDPAASADPSKVQDPEAYSEEMMQNVQGLASVLQEDLDDKSEEVKTKVTRCAIALPAKAPIYGTLVGILNDENLVFGAAVVEHVCRQLRNALSELPASHLTVKLLLRFLAELTNAKVVEPQSFVGLLTRFMPTAERIGTKADLLLSCALQTLPYAGGTLAESCDDAFDTFWMALSALFQSRKPNCVLRVVAASEPSQDLEDAAIEDPLQAVWAVAQQVKREGWKTASIFRPYAGLEEGGLHLGCGTDAKQHEIPADLAPPSSFPGDVQLYAHMPFLSREVGETVSAGAADDAAKVAELSETDRFMYHSYIRDILEAFRPDHKEAASQLVNWLSVLPVGAPRDLLLFEGFFAVQLQQPSKQIPSGYLTSVMLTLIKDNQAYAKPLAQIVLMFFEKIDRMDSGAVDRLTSFLAVFLSNFDYKWPWARFARVVQEEADSRSRLFVKAVLERCVRLSYVGRIGKVLEGNEATEPLLSLLPPQGKSKSKYLGDMSAEEEAALDDDVPTRGPSDSNATDEESGKTICKSLVSMIKRETDSTELMEWIETKMPADDTTADFRVETWMHALLHCGQKSYSHLITLIVRYENVMKSMKKEDGEAVIVTSVAEVWSAAPQIIHVIYDKFLGFRLIAPVALARWVFAADTSTQKGKLAEYQPWEVLYLAVDSCLGRVAEQAEKAKAPAFQIAGVAAHDSDAAVSKVEIEKFELFLAIFQVSVTRIEHTCTPCPRSCIFRCVSSFSLSSLASHPFISLARFLLAALRFLLAHFVSPPARCSPAADDNASYGAPQANGRRFRRMVPCRLMPIQRTRLQGEGFIWCLVWSCAAHSCAAHSFCCAMLFLLQYRDHIVPLLPQIKEKLPGIDERVEPLFASIARA
jgi:nuclear cap-binding protein subunit 1